MRIGGKGAALFGHHTAAGQMAGAGHTAGQNDHIYIREIHFGGQSIGHQANTVGRSDLALLADAGSIHGTARPAQKIHSQQALAFFKSIG